MIARVALLVAAALTAVLLDTVLLSGLTVAGVAPSTAIVVVLAVAVADGPGPGLRYGFGVGLLLDLVGEGLVGVSALVLVVAGYSVGVGQRFWSGNKLLGQLLAGSVGSAGIALGEAALGLVFDQAATPLAVVAVQVAVAGLFGLLLAPLIMPPVEWLSRRFAPVRVSGGPRARD